MKPYPSMQSDPKYPIASQSTAMTLAYLRERNVMRMRTMLARMKR